MERLGVDRGSPGWKRKFANDFERAVGVACKKLGPVAALQLAKCSPLHVLEATTRNDSGVLEVKVRDALLLKQAAAGAAEPTKPRNVETRFLCSAKLDNWRYRPKKPQVKLIPDVGYSIGHILVSQKVGVELLARSLRAVVEERNLELLGVARETAVEVLSAAVRASFLLQRTHFRVKAGVEGSKGGLKSGLKKIFQTKSVEDGTVQFCGPPANHC